jgi:xylan 1,4-beta-xylosidase
VLVWNYHDDDVPAPAAEIALTIKGIPSAHPTLELYRVDGANGNAYARWRAMGSPQPPTPAQLNELERASQIAPLVLSPSIDATGAPVVTTFTLPRQGVFLIKLTW